MSKMQEKKDSMQNSDLNHLRILIIQMLKGMILLAACLLLCWILFYKITAAPAIASAAIIGFFIYAIRVWLRWRKAPTNLTSAAASNPDHQSTPQDTKKELREELPKKIIYRAHWAFFVNLAYRPVLIFLVFLFFLIAGKEENWPIIAYPGIVPICLIVMVCMFLWIVYSFFDWINDLYIIEPDSVKDINKKPFAKKDINIAMMGKIQSVRFRKKGIIQLLLNFGTLVIVVGESEVDFDFVPEPEKVQQLILQRVEEYERLQKQLETDKQQFFIHELVTALKQSSSQSEVKTE
ncbi:hypothetical protein ATC1_13550 [Flexilinea flocculi]|uniref:Uncharacterized protein n=2 Tax=Flexilinea flocculi TaxID=1678840 RepID=A0A0S7BJR0_9CHLR|nr:hypothetical protein ATC1_13550 [Flexilinea flocculi]